LKLRTNPSTSSSVIDELRPGELFTIFEVVDGESYSPGNQNDWYEIEFEGKTGFVAAYYVDVVSSGDNKGQLILDAVNKVNAEQWYYIARDITGDGRKETFCNWFVADVLTQLGIDLPRYDRSAGYYPKPHPIYGNTNALKPYSAEHLFKFFKNGDNGKWTKIDATDALDKAKNGKVALASFSGSSGIQGHIAIVLPKGSASNIRIAQAGRTSSNNLAFVAGFGSHVSETKFFTYG
jgi:hypothetical protein